MTTIPPEKMAIYRETARRRQAAKREALLAWRERALAVVKQATAVLQEQFGAEQIFLFGSLGREIGPKLAIHAHSDIDLAAWGIPEEAYLRAVSALMDLDHTIEIDLVRLEEAPPRLQALVADEGVRLT